MEYPREQLEQIFLQLPTELKSALFSEINAVFIGQIAEKFHIPEEKIPLLAGQIGLVIMGILPPQNLASELKTVLNIDGQMSQAITQEINFKIFAPIRLSLRKIHGLITPEEISLEKIITPTPPSVPAPKPTSPTPAPKPESVSPTPAPKPVSPIPTPKPISPIPMSKPTSPISASTTPVDKSTLHPIPSSSSFKSKLPPTPISGKSPITSFAQPTPPPQPPTPPSQSTTPPPQPTLRPQPQPFIPPRPLTIPPGIIVPKTVTPASTPQKPAYESPALSPKPIIPPAISIPPKPTSATETTITPKPKVSTPTEPIDLTKININDPRLEGNIVDLKNLE